MSSPSSEGPRRGASGPLAPGPADLALAYAVGEDEPAGHMTARAVVADDGGLIALCTVTAAGGREHSELVRLNCDGELRGRRAYGPEHGGGRALDVLRSGYVFAGELPDGPVAFRGRLVRLDPGGAVTDAVTLGEPGNTGLSAVAGRADGSAVAGGTCRGRGWLVAGDAELELDGLVAVEALAACPDGGLVAAGTRERSTTSLGMASLTALDSQLSERWVRPLPDRGRGELSALAALPGGGGLAVGHWEASPDAAAELWCLRVDVDGQVVWERTLRLIDGAHRGRAVVVLPDGDVLAAGDAATGQGRVMIAVRLTTSGELAWQRCYDAADEVVRGATAADGGAVLAGSTTVGDTRRTEALICAIDGDGERRWERRLGPDGPAGST